MPSTYSRLQNSSQQLEAIHVAIYSKVTKGYCVSLKYQLSQDAQIYLQNASAAMCCCFALQLRDKMYCLFSLLSVISSESAAQVTANYGLPKARCSVLVNYAYIPERPHTTAAREKLKLAARAAQPIFTMNGSPCANQDIRYKVESTRRSAE